MAFERVGPAVLTISQKGGSKVQGRGQSWATKSLSSGLGQFCSN